MRHFECIVLYEHKRREIFKSALVYLSPFNANVTKWSATLAACALC